MDKYRVYNITIHADDRDKADVILEKHYHAGDIDEMRAEDGVIKDNGELVRTVSYWISPYICDDLGVIVNEFKQEGIRVL